MLRIRLRRVGKKGRPYYRIVVTEKRNPRDGAYIDGIGHYDPYGGPAGRNPRRKRGPWTGCAKALNPPDPVRPHFRPQRHLQQGQLG